MCRSYGLLFTFAFFLLGNALWAQQRPAAPLYLTVERIEIRGNHKTRPEVIRRYLAFRRGDAVHSGILERSWERLAQTNFFKRVDIFTRPGSKKGRIVVVVEVEERKWPYFQFEGGHSDLDGWYFVPISFRFDNLFGRGNFASLRLYYGDRISKVSLSFSNPSVFDDFGYLDLEAYGGERRFIHYINARELEQRVEISGVNLRFGGNHGLFKYLFFGWRSQMFRPAREARFTGTDSTLPAWLFPSPLKTDLMPLKIASFSLGLHADFRDHQLYPTRGLWGVIMYEKADEELGSQRDFDRFLVDLRLYQRLFGQSVLALHGKWGYTTREAPFYQRFYLAGANSLRGYSERRLTPVGYGSQLFLGQVEFRFPFSTRKTSNPKAVGVLFFDTGGIWLPDQAPHYLDFFRAVGFGFRLRLPIVGLTRLDFAFPLIKFEEKDFKLHLSLGHAF